MAGDMSSILRELEQVQDRLSLGGSDSGGEKLGLLRRQEELRTRAARLADDVDSAGSTQELLSHLAQLRRRRDLLDRQRGHGTRSPRSVSASGGAPQVDERIARIRVLLADRGIKVQ